MGKRRILLVLSIALLFFVSACGVPSNVTMTIINHGENISRNDDTELQEVLENIVSEECKTPMMLNLRLSASEVESYKDDGTYIEIEYENGKEFSAMTDSYETAIDKVYFLIGEEPSKCYIGYYTGKNNNIFFLSQTSCDVIRTHLE